MLHIVVKWTHYYATPCSWTSSTDVHRDLFDFQSFIQLLIHILISILISFSDAIKTKRQVRNVNNKYVV